MGLLIAALYVDPKGVYANLPDVEVWDETRDARLYTGPLPVVAHPPCQRWCRFAKGVEKQWGHPVGDDNGTFAAALNAVRRYGGVLEHPAHSLAWDTFHLPKPQSTVGWTTSVDDDGASCYIEQGRYGLPMRKATWLYAYGVDLPELRWGRRVDSEGGQYKWGSYLYKAPPNRDRPRLPASTQGHLKEPSYRDVCGKCGATRQDQQLGLEPTPDQYVHNMVGVFREVRRVLADHGTCWVNLGDSYAANGQRGNNNGEGASTMGWPGQRQETLNKAAGMELPAVQHGLKPKDLVGIPWRLAFALQADGWYLRSDIIWAKPNPMPESVTDRPTKAHEYVFLLSKRPRYWFDAEAVREPAEYGFRPTKNGNIFDRVGSAAVDPQKTPGVITHGGDGTSGRNVRSVWEIATQPYPEAHFATYPEELVRRCLLAGCPEWVCRVCGRPRERIVEETAEYAAWKARENGWVKRSGDLDLGRGTAGSGTNSATVPPKASTVGWSDCGHNNYRPGVVLDPFLGSGTTALVARKHGRHTIGIELNPTYAELAARRTRQLSLLT